MNLPTNQQANIQYMELKAAADFIGNGAIQVPEYERDILDLTRKRGVLGQRIPDVPATGHPHRYFEQTAIGTGNYTDPRNIATTTSGPTRVEKYSPVKALTGGIDYGLFDVEVTAQQGIFTQLVAKDLSDGISGMLQVEDKKIWTGDSSVNANEIDGLYKQITNTFTIDTGKSIVDGIRTQIATMMANQSLEVKPSAIYLNPLLQDLLEQEVKNASTTYKNILSREVEVIPGVTIPAMQTTAGLLPVVSDWALPNDLNAPTTPDGKTRYHIAILSENLIERAYITTAQPRVFQLGLIGDLATKYRFVKFNAFYAKAATYAHAFGTVIR